MIDEINKMKVMIYSICKSLGMRDREIDKWEKECEKIAKESVKKEFVPPEGQTTIDEFISIDK